MKSTPLSPLVVEAFEYGIHPLPIEVLVAVAHGEVDLNRLALEEMVIRGLDRDGRWVGFPESERLFDMSDSPKPSPEANMDNHSDAAVAAIEFALDNPDSALEFLNAWFYGEFDAIRRAWPEAPETIYVGADPLHGKRQAAVVNAN